ncbi:hypothetical protein, partial [uncultured Desulfovibrio sp.]|uniref:hypothetical protein n=1 Tax=uncultured Desulfovibrio sp. TaxID=167968 RepID=UPI002613D52C
RERCFPSPQAPHPFPSALLSGKSQEYEATPPPKTSGACTAYLFYLLKLFLERFKLKMLKNEEITVRRAA